MAEPVRRSIAAFVALVIVCGALIAGIAALTRERIEDNRAQRFLLTLGEVAGSVEAAAEVFWEGNVGLFCPLGRKDKVLLRGVARGYGGDIHWLAAANLSADRPVLERLRVTAHQETPGIADFLDRPAAGWLGSLEGKDRAELADVDLVSGATITSRALTRSLTLALQREDLGRGECPP